MISKTIKVPSVKQLLRLTDNDRGLAKAIRGVLVAVPPLDQYKGYAPTKKGALSLVGEMLEMYMDVEFMRLKDKRGNIWRIGYLNTGDAYRMTLMYMRTKGGPAKYIVGCWGDWAEKWNDATQDEDGYQEY